MAAKYRGMTAVTKNIEDKNPIIEKFDGGYVTNDYDKLITLTEPLFRWIAHKRSKQEGFAYSDQQGHGSEVLVQGVNVCY